VDNPKTIMTWARECIAIPRWVATRNLPDPPDPTRKRKWRERERASEKCFFSPFFSFIMIFFHLFQHLFLLSLLVARAQAPPFFSFLLLFFLRLVLDLSQTYL
jgi:hypothetical protein